MSTEINLINKIVVLDEGTILTSDATSLNFTGPGVIATSINGDVTIDITGGGAGSVTDVTASTPLFSTGGTTPDISIQQASALQDGYLSALDWTNFNSKVSSSLLGANNGVATLDSGGKVPVTQLPNSIMDYKGTYDIITNTPTLVNGTGNAGDVYINTAAGTRDFGAGPITVAIGDWLVYDGSVWQKSVNSNAVASVNGYTGIVTLGVADIPGAIGGSGTTNYVSKFTASGTIGDSALYNTGANTGIGVTSPISPLHISSVDKTVSSTLYTSDYITLSAEGTAPGFNIISSGSSVGNRGVFKATRSRGTLDIPTAVISGDNTFSLVAAGHDGTTNLTTAGITFLVDGAVSTNVLPQAITFATGAGSSRTERMRINSTGQVGINFVPSAASAPLTVKSTAVPSTAEAIASFLVTDSSANLNISNASTIDGIFVPSLTFTQATGNNNFASLYQGFITLSDDTSANPVHVFRTQTQNAGVYAPVITRPLYDFRNWTTSVMTIVASGNVGIGTTTPTKKLEVSADILVNTITIGLGSGSISSNTALGFQALRYNTTGTSNTGLGLNALVSNTTGFGNTAVGANAFTTNTTGSLNTAVGSDTLSVANTTNLTAVGSYALNSTTTGFDNTAVGTSALSTNTTGINNTAVGKEALANNTTSGYNAAFGRQTLRGNTTGTGNSSFGTMSLWVNTTGNFNSALGIYALQLNTTGSNNTAIGVHSLSKVTLGDNTALGYYSGTYLANGTTHNTDSSNSLFLGASTKSGTASSSNEIVIGYNVVGKGSNTAIIGLQGTTTDTWLAGYLHVNSAYKLPNADGTNGQILQTDGAGNATWQNSSGGTGTVTSVGLSMPSAFSVASSPITGAGTIAVTGAGISSQYVRGDGTLANFPTTTGGGASVSYYLNGSVSQGTIGGAVYQEINATPVIGAGTDFSITADGYIAQFITDAGDPNKLLIPGGNWNFETYFSASSGGGTPRFYIELYKYDGAIFTLISSSSASPENITGSTSIDLYFTALAVPPTVLSITDRLAVRFYVIHSGRTITMHTENSHLSQIITTFSTGLNALNGLTSQAQYFAIGTSGTDFNISSATDTHTFNIPTASATNRGALSSTDWSTFNSKQDTLTLTTTGSSGSASLVGSTLNVPTYTLAGLGGITLSSLSANTPLSYDSGTGAFSIQVATTAQNGYLSFADWNTFSGKVGGSGTANYVSKFTAGGTIGNSLIQDNGTNLGISTAPVAGTKVTIQGSTGHGLRANTTGDGKYGLYGSNVNDGPGTFVGVYGEALDNGGRFVNTTWVGGKFFATNGVDQDGVYSLWLQDGTESIGRFLKSITADGKANWATMSVADTGLTLTTTGSSGASTLVGNTLNIPQYTGGTGSFDYGLSYAMASQNILL